MISNRRAREAFYVLLFLYSLLTTDEPLPRYLGDVVFLVDSSSQLSRGNFTKEKQFVKTLARDLGVPTETSRTAVVLYDSLMRTPVRFETVKDLPTFSQTLDSQQQIGGGRRMDRALESAARIVQQGRPSVVILITGGKSDPDAKRLDEAVKPLIAKGAKTFAVVIGPTSLVSEVAPSVEDPQNIFQVRSFDELISKSKSIASSVVGT